MWGASYTVGPQTYMDTRPGLPQAERRHLAGGGVVELEHAGYGNPIMSAHVTGATAGTVGPHGDPREARPGGPRGDLVVPVGGGRHLRLRPDGRPRGRLLHRHPASHRVGLPPHRPRLLLHPHRCRGPLPPDAGPSGLLPDGVGRQRPAHRAAGAELLRGPVRSRSALRSPTSSRRPSRARSPSPSPGPTSWRCATGSPNEDEQVFEHLWRTLGLSVDWSHTYATVSDRAQRVSQRGFLRLAARGQVVQRTAPTLWDVDFRTAVSQAELEDRDRPGAYHRLRFPRVGAEGGVDIETTRPELLPACVALVAHPDDERYRPLFGYRGGHAAVRGAGAGSGPRAGRPREGVGDRHDLHLRRHHRRGVVAGAEPAHPDDPRAATAACCRWSGAPRDGSRTIPDGQPGPTSSWPAARSTRRRSGSSSCWPSPGTSSVTPAPSPIRSSSTRRATARWRSSRPASGSCSPSPSGTDCWPGGRSCAGTRPTWPTATGPGWKGSTATGTSADSGSSGFPSRSGTPSTPTVRPTSTAPSSPLRTACPSTRPPTYPTGTRTTSGAGPAGSWAIRTSWTPGPPRRSAPRSPEGGWTTPTCSPGSSPWTCGPRPTRSSAPGSSRPWSDPSWSTARSRGPTRPSRAGSSTRTTRRCPSPRAMWSPRSPCWRSTVPTRCATGPPAAGQGPIPRSTRAR